MAICDYCGTTYRGGAIKDGAYRYCNGQCAERGKFFLTKLERIPENKIDAFVMDQHAGPCPECDQSSSVDVYQSYQIWSAVIYSQWWTNRFVACRKCARIRQAKHLAYCLAAGFWSPPGLLITPFQIIFNVAAILRRQDPAVPSDRFYKLTRLNLGRLLVDRGV
jgi:hypothetical protein